MVRITTRYSKLIKYWNNLDYEAIGSYEPGSQQAQQFKKTRGIKTGLSKNTLELDSNNFYSRRLDRERTIEEKESPRKLTRKQTILKRKQTIFDTDYIKEEQKEDSMSSPGWNANPEFYTASKGYVEDIEGVQSFFGQLGLFVVACLTVFFRISMLSNHFLHTDICVLIAIN